MTVQKTTRERGTPEEIASLLRDCDRPVNLSDLMDDGADAIDQLRRAFLRYIQEENGCNRRQERAGEPCREPARCGCHLEMMAQYADAE